MPACAERPNGKRQRFPWPLPHFDEWWHHEEYWERLLHIARTMETESNLLRVSAHLIDAAEKGQYRDRSREVHFTRRREKMNAEQRAGVEKAVVAATDEYFKVASRLDMSGFMSLFADIDGVTIAENGVIYPSRKAFYEDYVLGFFRDAAELDASCEERRVFPLAPDAALATGTFRWAARLRSGDAVGGRNAFTFVFVKVGDRWQMVHVHESTIPGASA